MIYTLLNLSRFDLICLHIHCILNLILFKNFHTMYFYHILFPSSTPPRSSPPLTHLASCSFSFFFKKRKKSKQQNSKQTKKKKIKIPKESKPKQRVQKTKYRVCFVLALLQGMGPALESGCYIQWHSLEKTDFPPSKYQLQITSWLVVGLCVYFPFSKLEFCLVSTCAGFVYAVTVSVSFYIHCIFE